MPQYNNVHSKQVFMGKLDYGKDLLEELTTVCVDNGIRLGRIEAIGAVQKATIGYYDQQTKKYNFFEIDEHLEIAALVGNISLREGQPMVHAHITLSDKDGKAFGGHLATGTVVFACEFVIHAYDGPDYFRGHDEQTGLPLWKM